MNALDFYRGCRVELTDKAKDTFVRNHTSCGVVRAWTADLKYVTVLRDGLRNAERWSADFWKLEEKATKRRKG